MLVMTDHGRVWGGGVEEERVLETSSVYVCVRMPYMFMCVCICAEACGGGSLCVCLHFLSAVNKLPCYRDYIHPHVLPDLYHEIAPTSDPEIDS